MCSFAKNRLWVLSFGMFRQSPWWPLNTFSCGTYNILLIRSYLPRNGWREIIEGKSLIWWAKWFPFAFCSLSVKVSHQEINEIYWLGWMNMNKTNRHKDSSAAQQTQTIDDTSIMCLFQQLQARYVTILIWSLQKCRGQFERGSRTAWAQVPF